MDRGWIKLHRKLLCDAVWLKSTKEQQVILITLLLMANHEENEWEWQGEKFIVKAGQFITSIDSIVQATGKKVTTQNVRSALKKFEKLNFLTNTSTKTGRLITIAKWEKYQVEDIGLNKADNKDLTKRQQRGNKEVTPNKNDKNDKNEKNNKNTCAKYAHEIDILWNLYPRKEGKAKAIAKLPKLIEKYGFEKVREAVEAYAEEVQDREKQFIKHGSTFFNGGILDYIDREVPAKVGRWITVEDEDGIYHRKWVVD